jgi:hypothetical protein
VQLQLFVTKQLGIDIIWSDIRIDSAGGSNPIVSHGHRKDDARAIRDLIERFQQNLRVSQGPNA